jgi:hypothetical protein
VIDGSADAVEMPSHLPEMPQQEGFVFGPLEPIREVLESDESDVIH